MSRILTVHEVVLDTGGRALHVFTEEQGLPARLDEQMLGKTASWLVRIVDARTGKTVVVNPDRIAAILPLRDVEFDVPPITTGGFE